MSNKNCDNPHIGRIFQIAVKNILCKRYNTDFDLEVSIEIGNPPKPHKFDLATEDESIVVECKCYTWTDTGNVPSAKLMGLDEAVFYFGFLPRKTTKIICMKRSVFPGKEETLAEYYVRVHGHLLNDVKIFEFSDDGNIKEIR
jgi:hypothetical protein